MSASSNNKHRFQPRFFQLRSGNVSCNTSDGLLVTWSRSHGAKMDKSRDQCSHGKFRVVKICILILAVGLISALIHLLLLLLLQHESAGTF